MKLLLSFLLVGSIFFVQYEGYYFNPCSGDVCLAIEGYNVAPKTHFCASVECIEDVLAKKGVEYLEGVFQLDFPYLEDGATSTLKEIDVVHRVTVKP